MPFAHGCVRNVAARSELVMLSEHVGGLLSFHTPEGSLVYVDPLLVAYVEPHAGTARLVFVGGFDLLVQDEERSAHEIIGSHKPTLTR